MSLHALLRSWFSEPLPSTQESPISIVPQDLALPRSYRRVTLAAEPVDFRTAQLNQLREKQHLQPAAAPPTTPAQLLSSPHSDTPSPLTPLEFFSVACYPIRKAPPAHLTLACCPGTAPPRQKSMIRPRQRHMKCSTGACQRQLLKY